MNLNLTSALANALPAQAGTRGVVVERSRRRLLKQAGKSAPMRADLPTSRWEAAFKQAAQSAPMRVDKPILQLNDWPVTLAPTEFENPHSPQNPDGNMKASYAFRNLVDPVPFFSRTYNDSGDSTEELYGNLVNFASILENQRFVEGVFSKAQKKFREAALMDLSVAPGEWRLVGAVPNDWYDVAQVQRFRDVELDLTGSEDAGSPFTILPGKESPEWRMGDPEQPEATKAPHRDTKMSLKFKYLQVNFERPWLNPELFRLHGWFLQGQGRGYYSTGRINKNRGVLPLLPTGLVLGIDVEAKIDPAGEDRGLVAKAARANKLLSLGPFQLEVLKMSRGSKEVRSSASGLASARPVLIVVGWISTLVPLAPKDAEPARRKPAR